MKSLGTQNQQGSKCVILDGFNSDCEFDNVLNFFYCHFDTYDFSTEMQDISHNLRDTQHFNIAVKYVDKAFCSL